MKVLVLIYKEFEVKSSSKRWSIAEHWPCDNVTRATMAVWFVMYTEMWKPGITHNSSAVFELYW